MKNDLFSGVPATLEEILCSREQRVLRQRELLKEYAAPVVCLLCNMPGAVKRNAASAYVFQRGEEALLQMLEAAGLPLVYRETSSLLTGPEGYFCIQAPPEALKRRCCAVEERHRLGRLFDLDVIHQNGVPVSRVAIGLPARRCLLCGDMAANCVSSQKHALCDIYEVISGLLEGSGPGSENLSPWGKGGA